VGRLGIALRIAFVIVTAPLAWGATSASCTWGHDTHAFTARGATLHGWATRHLDAPFAGYGALDDLTVRAFDAILVSNLAMGLHQTARLDASREAECARSLRLAADRIVSAQVSPTRLALERMPLDDHNLYFSHALLVLALSRAHGDDRRDALAARLAAHLAARSAADATFHARSYPGSSRWPADQSATLAALYAFDQVYASDRGARATRGWLAWARGHHTRDGLPWSATGGLSYARISRGCALSYLVLYTAQFAPDESDAWYRAYTQHHGIALGGVEGFREWPVGVDRGSDADAGLVLFGWGMAATGIGLGAARIHGDEARAVGIERIADLVGMPVGDHYALAPTLGTAMLFAGETATPWFGDPVARASERRVSWPWLPALLAALSVAFDAWLVRGAWLSVARGRRSSAG
jgi:hypothetical protein